MRPRSVMSQCLDCETSRSLPLKWPGDCSYPSDGRVVSVGVHAACYWSVIEPIFNHSRPPYTDHEVSTSRIAVVVTSKSSKRITDYPIVVGERQRHRLVCPGSHFLAASPPHVHDSPSYCVPTTWSYNDNLKKSIFCYR